MKVRIVCYEDPNAWILGKFARRMAEEMKKLSVDVAITRTPDPKADINHHIIYVDYNGKKTSIDTVMITHIDSLQKINTLKKQLQAAQLGVCMSEETMRHLAEAGVPRDRLCYVNPAHDGVMKPRPTVVGITSKTHGDGRKKENTLIKLCEKISPGDFAFKIMGSGWDKIVEEMKAKGFSIEYHSQFDYDRYLKLMPSLDYFIYFSWDEGSMGFIDALAAGVKTIVTPQGYHLDAPGGITHPIKDFDDIAKTFAQIAAEKQALTDSVADWTWANYAKKHVALWEYLVTERSVNYLTAHPRDYHDGIMSLADNPHAKIDTKTDKVAATRRKIGYILQPLTLKMFLWKIAPTPLKSAYKKRVEK